MKNFIILTAAIGRDSDGMIFYVGPTDVCLSKACDRCNAAAKEGRLPAEEDMAMVESLPLLDEKLIEASDLMLV